MKKTYFAPEIEVVDLNMEQVLLSDSLPVFDDPAGEDDILAPENIEVAL